MSDISSEMNETIGLFNGTLIIGNHDSITLFGCLSQNNLKECSRRISNILLYGTEELDAEIAEILKKIEQFEAKADVSGLTPLTKRLRHKAVVKEYNKIISYIENMTQFFKLQQAQIIKEIKLLEILSDNVSQCVEELASCIETGKSILSERASSHKESGCSHPHLGGDSGLEMWYERLEKRINDLSVSHTVALQSKAQIKMLFNNDLTLLDRIANTVSNTFPIWQNQIAIMLGVELFERRLNAQERVSGISSFKAYKPSRKGANETQHMLSTGRILELNRSLTTALNEMSKLESTNAVLREDFIDVSQHMERG